jgi:DNA topoisomerase-1
MRHLVIVESPSKCKTIEKYLGDEYRVIATCGHFRSLNKLEQINRTTLEIKFETTKSKIVKYLKEEVGIAKSVILATDDDREGEAIAWHICKVCKLPLTTPRIIFHEITKQAIQHAITHPTVLSLSRVMAQHTRQILDLYIGYTISPILWKAIQHTLSAGRCQTPALHMICEQQDRIQQQSSETSFKVKGYFTNKQIEFTLERNLSQEEIEPFLSNITTFELEPPETKEVKLSPPPILITSTLQQKASQSLHLSPKQIMASAQLLYEHGLITYMRTDQATYSEDFIKIVQDHLGNQFMRPQNKGEGAHEGIRITQLEIKTTSFDKNTDRVYAFIYKHTLQTCMKPTILCHKIYKTLCNGIYFIHTSVSVKEKGWSDVEEKDWSSYLDHLKRFHCEHIHAEEQLCEQEFHWTEAQLIRSLEKNKIGRPSTYTHIVETLQDKKYVSLGKIQRPSLQLRCYEWKEQKIEKKTITKEIEESCKLCLTPLGKEVHDFCYQHFESLFNYPYSSLLEEKLDEIENGLDYKSFLYETMNSVDSASNIKIVAKQYPSLHAGTYRSHAVVIKDGRYGYYMEYNGLSISLKEYPKYEAIAGWIRDQSIPSESLKELMDYKDKNDHILLVVNSEWSLRQGTYGPYLFHKNSKMKKPKFYKYTHGQSKEEIEDYIQKNIKV